MASTESSISYEKPGLTLALVPVVLTLLVLGVQLFYFGDFTPHIPLAIGMAITGLVGIKLGFCCQVSPDCIPVNSYPLFQARQALRDCLTA
ncbi:hypothetical protein, partial [Arhodomonas sp. AD133]|uniref:hypothetical protein n=1 Tax=Arhodomonas sp. AD133 TaxID=3415009 RepID=UPI003EBC58B1